jgi:hypothetical protein
MDNFRVAGNLPPPPQSKKMMHSALHLRTLIRVMKLLAFILLASFNSLVSLGQDMNFDTRHFKGALTVSQTSDTSATYTLTLTNTTTDNIFLLKSWTSFESVQKNNPATVYFDLTFPPSGDIYQCKSCNFELYKVKPDSMLSLSVVKTQFQKVSEVIVYYDPIFAEKLANKQLKKQLIKSDKQHVPRISFRYYFDSGGMPLNPNLVKFKI